MTFSFSYPKSGLIAVRTKAEISSFPSFSVHEADESTVSHSPSLPTLPPAGIFARNLRRTVQPALRSGHFSSVVVICNTLRRLASVLLLRLSQPPRPSSWLVKNWCGLPITRRSVFSRCQSLQKPQRGLLKSFQSFLRFFALVHNKDSSEGMLKCAPKEFPKPEKDIPRTS